VLTFKDLYVNEWFYFISDDGSIHQKTASQKVSDTTYQYPDPENSWKYTIKPDRAVIRAQTAQMIPNMILINTFYEIDIDGRAEWYADIHNPSNDYDGYCAAPIVIEKDNKRLSKCGFNSDNGKIHYSTRAYRNLTAFVLA
jgi:hypothetical protein